MNDSHSRKEKWNKANFFWHYFNFCSPLPPWISHFRSVLNLFQVSIILFGWSVVTNRHDNELIYSLKSIANFIVFLDFTNSAITATMFFLLSIFSLILLISGYMFKFVVLSSIFLIIFHIFYNFLIPTTIIVIFPTLTRSIVLYQDEQLDLFYLIIHLISAILLLVLFTIKTLYTSRSLIVTADFTRPWNSWITYFRIVIASLIPLTTLFQNDVVLHDSYYVLCLLYSLAFVWFGLSHVYIQPVINILYLALNISFCLLSIISIIFYHVTSLDESIDIFISFAVILLSFFISYSLYNYECDKNAQLLRSTEQHNEEQLGNRYDIRHEGNRSFPEYLANNIQSISILRQQSLINPKGALEFAEYLLRDSSNVYIITESIRFLVLLQFNKESLYQIVNNLDPNSFPFLTRQLIYDAKMFVVAMDISITSIEEELAKLHSLFIAIQNNLIGFSEAILIGDRQATVQKVFNYTSLCIEFEETCLLALMQSPNSSHLSRYFANYYMHLRGDYVRGHSWTQNADNIEFLNKLNIPGDKNYRSPTTNYGSRVFQASTQKLIDQMSQNRLKSQEAISKVHSKAVWRSVIALCIMVLFILFVIFFKFELSDFNIIFSKETGVIFQALSASIILPIKRATDFSINIVNNESLKYPIDIPSNQVFSSAIQNLTAFITPIQNSRKQKTEIYEFWSVPINTSSVYSASCQFLMLQIYGLTKLIPYNQPKNITIPFLKNYLQSYFAIYTPFTMLKIKIRQFINTLLSQQNKFSFLISLLTTVCLIVLVLLVLYYMIHVTKTEINHFWTVFLGLDDSIIESFQSVFRIDQSPEADKPDYVRNITSPEEIEIDENDNIVFKDDPVVDNRTMSRFSPLNPKAFIFYSILFIVLLIVAHIFYITVISHIVNHSILANDSADQINWILINISNAAADATSLLAFGLNSSGGQIMADYINRHFNQVYLYDIELVDSKIQDIFDKSIELQDKLLKLLPKWVENGYQIDDDLYTILYYSLNSTDPLFRAVDEWRLKKFEAYQRTKLTVSIIFSFFVFIIFFFYVVCFYLHIFYYYSRFNSLKSIMLLFPSHYMSTISNLITLFYPESSTEGKSHDFIKLQSRYILKQSINAIMIFDHNQQVQDVNKSAEELIGIKRDELIGMDLRRIINSEDISLQDMSSYSSNEIWQSDQETAGFYQHINYLHAQPATSNVLMFHLHVIKSDNTLNPVSCILMKIDNRSLEDQLSNSARINVNYPMLPTVDESSPAFALIMDDRTMFTEQENELQNTKKRIQALLYRILPRVMAAKLLSRNQKLQSKVDKATVIFIGLVNFTQWCRVHSPVEIMEYLDVVCSMFDQNISKFKSLVKLKVINGTYMAAGGLFNEETNKPYPLEAVEFSILCAQSIAQRNQQLSRTSSSDMKLAIGINTGGPIISGILGIDKPLFDIWGDAVNISSRLQTSCPPNCIQMSKETMESLPDGLFNIEMRDGVYLKGKGYTNTFIISLDAIMHNDNS